MGVCQQFSGVNAVMYYSNDIFRETGAAKNAAIFTTSIGIVQIAATLLSSLVIEKTGRRRIYLIGYWIVFLSLVVLIISFQA